MPELDFAILCEAARVADNLMYVLAGGWDTLSGEERSVQTVSVALRFLFTQGECGRPHRIEVIVQGVDGQRLTSITGIIVAEVPLAGLPAGWRVNAMTQIRFPVAFPAFGEYSIEVLVNDSSLKSLPVRFVPPPSVQRSASRGASEQP